MVHTVDSTISHLSPKSHTRSMRTVLTLVVSLKTLASHWSYPFGCRLDIIITGNKPAKKETATNSTRSDPSIGTSRACTVYRIQAKSKHRNAAKGHNSTNSKHKKQSKTVFSGNGNACSDRRSKQSKEKKKYVKGLRRKLESRKSHKCGQAVE